MMKVRDINVAESIFLGDKELKVLDGKLLVDEEEFLLVNSSELLPGVPLTINQEGTISPLVFMETITLHVNETTGNDDLTSGEEALPYKTLDKAFEDAKLYGFYSSIVIVIHGRADLHDSHTVVQEKDITIRGAYGSSPMMYITATDDGLSESLTIRKGASVYIENIEIKQESYLDTASSIFIGEIAYFSAVGLTFATSTRASLIESYGNISIKVNVSNISNIYSPLINNMGSTMIFMSIDAPTTFASLNGTDIATNAIVDAQGRSLNLFISKAS